MRGRFFKILAVSALLPLLAMLLVVTTSRASRSNLPSPANTTPVGQDTGDTSLRPGLVVSKPGGESFKTASEKLGNFGLYGSATRSFMPDSVKFLFDKDVSVSAKLDAVHKLGKRLSREEIEAMLSFVVNGEGGLDNAAVKNDILNKICVQEELPPGIDDFLFNMMKSPHVDATMRNYALQHMGFLGHDRLKDSPLIKKALEWALAQGPDLSTTALVCMDSISASGNSAMTDSDSVAKTSREMLSRVSPESPMSASVLQVAARNGVKEALLAATKNLTSPGVIPPSTLLSSIAVVGMMGEEKDAEVFNKLLADRRLAYCRNAVNTAWENIRKRQEAK